MFGWRIDYRKLHGLFRKTARADRIWPVDRPRGTAGLVGPWPALWTEVGALGPPVHGGPGPIGSGAHGTVAWSAVAAPWPRCSGSPWRRYGTRGAVPRGRACCARQGDLDVRAGRSREWPRRTGRAVGRLDGGRRTPARPCTRKEGRKSVRRARVCSSPRCERRGSVVVVGDAVAEGIDVGSTSVAR